MVLLTILLLTLIILTVVFIVAASLLGAGTIVIFGDVIVCAVFIALIIKWIIKNKRGS